VNPARSQLAALLSARLFDDASMYPPSNLPLPDAVRAHLQHRRAGYRACVGPFVCGEASLPDVSAAIASDALAVSVVSRSVAGLSVAEDTARRLPGITLASLEVVLGSNTIGDGLRRSDPARLRSTSRLRCPTSRPVWRRS
jgi:hypothetical protein